MAIIRNVGLAPKTALEQYRRAAQPNEAGSFRRLLDEVASRYGAVETNAKDATDAVLAGADVQSHDVMIAAQEASLAFELILEVRNKLLDAYHELMRMQV